MQKTYKNGIFGGKRNLKVQRKNIPIFKSPLKQEVQKKNCQIFEVSIFRSAKF